MAGGLTLNLGFDAATLRAAKMLLEFEPILAAQLVDAHKESLDELMQAAQAVMMEGFKDPAGAMETAWKSNVTSPYKSWLRNTAKYSQRRHYGFSGMTDSLGRFYPDDPGIFWVDTTIELATPAIWQIFATHVNDALNEVAG